MQPILSYFFNSYSDHVASLGPNSCESRLLVRHLINWHLVCIVPTKTLSRYRKQAQTTQTEGRTCLLMYFQKREGVELAARRISHIIFVLLDSTTYTPRKITLHALSSYLSTDIKSRPSLEKNVV